MLNTFSPDPTVYPDFNGREEVRFLMMQSGVPTMNASVDADKQSARFPKYLSEFTTDDIARKLFRDEYEKKAALYRKKREEDMARLVMRTPQTTFTYPSQVRPPTREQMLSGNYVPQSMGQQITSRQGVMGTSHMPIPYASPRTHLWSIPIRFE